MAQEVNSSVGICAVAAYVPEGRLDVSDAARGFGASEEFLKTKTGYFKVARKDPGEETSDLAAKAVSKVLEQRGDVAAKLGLLIVVTQNPDGYGLPHTAAIVHGKLGLPTSVAAFDISLGCSGWVYALSVARSFMESNGIGHGIVVTADPYSKVLDPQDRNTMLLFGDAATATLLGHDPRWSVGRFVFGTEGQQWKDLRVDESRHLAMNGRSIFMFSATRVPDCLRAALQANGLTLEQVDRLLLHQGSRYIVDTIGQRMRCPERTLFHESDIGNAVSSSIPLVLAHGLCEADRVILTCGFGVGLSWAATVLTRNSAQ